MSSISATLFASLYASKEQHLFSIPCNSVLCSLVFGVSCQKRIKTPTTSYPWFFRIAAATEESTPPDMATTTFFFCFFTIISLFYNKFSKKTINLSLKNKYIRNNSGDTNLSVWTLRRFLLVHHLF